MVVTNDEKLAEQATLYRGQGQAFDRTYWHPVIGYNYRMTNVEAAIGVAQLEGLEERLARRAAIAERYRSNLSSVPGLELQRPSSGSRHANWLVGAALPVRTAVERDHIAAQLLECGIETRPFFFPIHTMPPYAREDTNPLPVAEDLSGRGLCLPTWVGLGDEDIDYISECLAKTLGGR
jgi:perosamine synthetase